MTVCNMAIEAGARSGLVAVDDKTIDYFRGRPYAPTGEMWHQAVEYWRTLRSDDGAHFDKVIEINARDIYQMVAWGTSVEMVFPFEAALHDLGSGRDSHNSQGVCGGLVDLWLTTL